MRQLATCSCCAATMSPRDRFCAECGADHRRMLGIERLTEVGLDPAAIWLWEIGLHRRIPTALARVGLYVVSDLIGRSEDEVLGFRNCSPKVIDELRAAISDLAAQPDAIRAACSLRAGTCFEPAGLAMGADLRRRTQELRIDTGRVSVRSLVLSKPTRDTLLRGGLKSLADLMAVCNLELMRRINLPSPEILEELQHCADGLQARLGPIASAVPVPPPANDGYVPASDPSVDAATSGLLALVVAFERIDSRPRSVMRRRLGLDGVLPMTLEEVGNEEGVTRERARQIEKRAMTELRLRRSLADPAFDHAAEIRGRLGLAWHDGRLSSAIAGLSAHPAWSDGDNVALLLSVFDDRMDSEDGVRDIEAATVVVIAEYGAQPVEDLAERVSSLLDEEATRRFPRLSVSERIRLVGPAVEGSDGLYDLDGGPVDGVDDRRLRRLVAMRRILETHGPSHYSAIAVALDAALPEAYRLSERDVRNWLDRYSSLFVWAGPGTYGLPSHGVGVRPMAGRPPAGAEQPDGRRPRRGIADEIEVVLKERGAMPLVEVQAHILGRFTVKATSVAPAILLDRRRRFDLNGEQVVTLRAG